MVEFTDLTMREADGSYSKVVELMCQDGSPPTWMLRSDVFVQVEAMTGVFLINFWNDGQVIIDEMLRPASLEVPNDDIVELSKWADEKGWKRPEPSRKMLDSPRLFDFWQRQYESGLISCSMIEEREMDLLDKVIQSEKEE